jgi:hypothetical protein
MKTMIIKPRAMGKTTEIIEEVLAHVRSPMPNPDVRGAELKQKLGVE